MTGQMIRDIEMLIESVAGYGRGRSTLSLFARVGDGIFTKAADLRADLVDKYESDLPEDSLENPATELQLIMWEIMLGVVAGMSADLFGSFAQSTCAALVIGGCYFDYGTFLFILAITAINILVCLVVASPITEDSEIDANEKVQANLKYQLVYSTIILISLLWIVSDIFFDDFILSIMIK